MYAIDICQFLKYKSDPAKVQRSCPVFCDVPSVSGVGGGQVAAVLHRHRLQALQCCCLLLSEMGRKV